ATTDRDRARRKPTLAVSAPPGQTLTLRTVCLQAHRRADLDEVVEGRVRHALTVEIAGQRAAREHALRVERAAAVGVAVGDVGHRHAAVQLAHHGALALLAADRAGVAVAELDQRLVLAEAHLVGDDLEVAHALAVEHRPDHGLEAAGHDNHTAARAL